MYKFLTSLHIHTCPSCGVILTRQQVNPKLINNNWNNIVIHDDCSPKKKTAHCGVGEGDVACKNPVCEVVGSLNLEYLSITLPAPGRKCSCTLQDHILE